MANVVNAIDFFAKLLGVDPSSLQLGKTLPPGQSFPEGDSPVSASCIPEPMAEQEAFSEEIQAGACEARWGKGIEAAAIFIQLLPVEDLPESPFEFGCLGRTVVDREKFLGWLKAEAARGPLGPCARYGAIQRDLVELQNLLLSGDA